VKPNDRKLAATDFFWKLAEPFLAEGSAPPSTAHNIYYVD
jgi:hypothetical protein